MPRHYTKEELYWNYNFPSMDYIDEFGRNLHLEWVLLDKEHNSYCVVIRNAIPNDMCKSLYDECVRDCTLQIYNTTYSTYPQPRLNCVYSDPGITKQKYSGTEVPTIPWSPLMQQLRDYVNRDGFISNAALVNGYIYSKSNPYIDKNGKITNRVDYVDYHPDRELRDSRNIVATVSLGGSRVFSFMRTEDECLMAPVHLHNGDLVYFWGETNTYYKHSILKPVHGTDSRPRYSVTFRVIDIK